MLLVVCCIMLKPGASIVPEKPFEMSQLYFSPSLFPSRSDLNLVESIPREDLMALLPIIKMAFPFINSGMLAINSNLHGCANLVPGFVHAKKRPLQQHIGDNVNKLSQPAEYLSSLPMSVNVMAFSGQQKVEVDSFTVTVASSSSSFTSQSQMFQSKTCQAGGTFDEGFDQLPCNACLTSIETDPQIAVSSMTDLSHLRMMDMKAMPFSDKGNGVVHMGKCSNLSSDNASPLSRSTECSNVVDGPHLSTSFCTTAGSGNGPIGNARDQSITELNRHGDMTGKPCKKVLKTTNRIKAADVREANVFVDRKRRFELTESVCFVHCEHVSQIEQVSQRISRGDTLVVSPLDLNETSIKKAQSGSVSSSKAGWSDEFPSLDAVDCTTLDSTMQKHGLKRCHRTNGEQCRCSKNTFSGTSYYCQHHLEYSKGRNINASQFPRILHPPNSERNALDTSGGKNDVLHTWIPESPGDKHGALVKRANLEVSRYKEESKEKTVDGPRCRRRDGKLWQCSKQAREGSIYCDHHSKTQRYKKSGKCEGASKTKQGVVSRGSKTSNKEEKQGVVSRGSKTSNKEEKDVQACCVSTLQAEREAQQMSGRSVISHESGNGKQDILEAEESPEDIQSSEQAMHSVKQCVFRGAHDIGWSEHSTVEYRGIETVHVVQCRWREENQLQCPKLSKAGSVFCEHHQPSLRDIKHVLAVSQDEVQCDGAPVHHIYSVPGVVCVEEQIDKEASTQQCKRTDGKGWQCSQAPKHGFRYCEHHVLYLSQRYAKKAQKKQSEGSTICEMDKK